MSRLPWPSAWPWCPTGVYSASSGKRALTGLEHSLVGILLLLGYMAANGGNRANIGQAVGVSLAALVPCYLGTVFPDLDIRLLGIGGHRNPLFHSSISFFVPVLLVRRQARFLHILVAGYGVGLASHLWWDIIDYGNVRWLPGGTLDRLWLGIHGLLCLMTPVSRSLRGNGPE